MTVRSLRAAAVLVAMAPLYLLPAVSVSAAATSTWERCYAAPKPSGTRGISLRNHTSLLPTTALRGRYGHAAGWGDTNGDGLADLFLGTYAEYPPLMSNPDWRDAEYDYAPDLLLLNTGSGFRVDPAFPKIYGWTSGVVFTDLDRDGDDDLVVSRFAETAYTTTDSERARAGNTVLLRNDGGRFTQTSALPAGPGGRLGGRSVGVLDYDGDGFLDLLFVQDRYSGASSRLLRNPGSLDQPWIDVTAAAKLPLNLEGFSVTTSNLSGDGRADLFVVGSDRLFVGRPGGVFEEATANVPAGPAPMHIGTDGTVHDFYTGASSADMNGDGRIDLLMGAHFTSVETHGNAVPPVRLLVNRGNDTTGRPRFTDDTSEAKLPTAVKSKSATVHAVDANNDRIMDIVAGVSNGTTLDSVVPTVFRGTGRNTPNGTPQFASPSDIAAVKGYTTPNAAMAWVAAPWSDYDRDGRLDLFADYFFNYAGVRLFSNGTATGSWLGVRLDTRRWTAPGAVVEVYTAGGLGSASQLLGRRTITATDGYAAAVPVEARFGFGSTSATQVDVRVIPPPGSPTGLTEARRVPLNQMVSFGGPCRR
ncbi:MAG: CRTAC1 family protein [Actinomycetota bacterium]|nr:CRTAC1 family protein [Actinomycetota bacterium]